MSRNGTTTRAGFTILELLTAMTILLIVAMMMGRIFTHSNTAWQIGTGEAEMNTMGRAASDLIARDVSQAVTGTNLALVVQPDRTGMQTYGLPVDELCLVSLSGTPRADERDVREIYYYVRPMTDGAGKELESRYELARGYYSRELLDPYECLSHCYHNSNWWATLPRPADSEVLAENISGLRFEAFSHPETNEAAYNSVAHNGALPYWVDVYLEVLSEDDAIRAAALPKGDDRQKFVERRARRFTARAQCFNRNGYIAKKPSESPVSVP